LLLLLVLPKDLYLNRTPSHVGFGPPFILKGDATVAYARATRLALVSIGARLTRQPTWLCTPCSWHRSNSPCQLDPSRTEEAPVDLTRLRITTPLGDTRAPRLPPCPARRRTVHRARNTVHLLTLGYPGRQRRQTTCPSGRGTSPGHLPGSLRGGPGT